MGAIVGGLYASGMSSAEIKRFVLHELELSSFMENPAFRLGGKIGKIIQAGSMIGGLASKAGIDSGERVLALLERLTGGKKFEECAIPFRCNAVDISGGREIIFKSGSLARAIRSSMSFPAFFAPYVMGDLCLVDGGVVDNMPVKAAREEGRHFGIKRYLAVDTRKWNPLPSGGFKNGVSVAMRCFDVLVRIAEAARYGSSPAGDASSQWGIFSAAQISGGYRHLRKLRADLVLHAVDGSGVTDFHRKAELVSLGEEAVRRSGTELGAFFDKGIAAFVRKKNSHCGIKIDNYWGDNNE
jgi:NTE family protein